VPAGVTFPPLARDDVATVRATGALVLTRWAIRFGMDLVGVAAGLLICDAVLSGLHISAKGLVVATLIFWFVHFVIQIFALRTLVRMLSVALAGLLAIASTIVSLFIVNLVVSGLSINGFTTYLFATLIIWATSFTADVMAQRMIRQRRLDRHRN